MDSPDNRFLWFLASFAPCFGGFVALHFANRNDGWVGAIELLAALVSIPVLITAWAISRGSNRPLAQGFIWSLAANFIFMFTFGGCSLMRL